MSALAEIARRNPEWRPWLDAVQELLSELSNPAWDKAVPAAVARREGVALAVGAGLHPEATPIPLLHACRRQWTAALPKSWPHGHCPLCGAWPGYAELCGVERTRYLRCVRCGCAWRALGLSCVYCANGDHAQLGSLVDEEGGKWVIEVCRRCKGYLKACAVLSPGDPAEVLVEDLKSVELDIAAEERGYRRPTRHDAA